MQYNLDLEKISLHDYKELLKKQNLLPGRRILLDDIDERFSLLLNHGISNVLELRKALSASKKITVLSSQTGIPEDYLVILKREAGSLEQKPIPLDNFPETDSELIFSLNQEGIKTSKDYFELKKPFDEMLYCLCDLVRINGVGPAAARAFFEAGYKSVMDVANADATQMLSAVSKVNEQKQYYKAKLGVKDMQFCIDFATVLIKLS